MSIAMRLKVMSFLQYFIWGSWLVTLGSYMINTLHFTGANVGMVYSSKGIAAIIMPGIMGIIADKWLRAERAYMLCHLVCAGVLFYAASVTDVLGDVSKCDGVYADYCVIEQRLLFLSCPGRA